MVTDRQRLIAAERVPFQRLIKLIEIELELAAEGQIDELREAINRTGAYMETLPKPAPASAHPLVLQADAMRGRVTIEAERMRDKLTLSRKALRQGRRIARRYGPPLAGRYSTTA
ncbi:MAG TPA: hypothetical protein VHU61_16900 [Solirubrobacteraceae bacterium]|jgi:hypothetical protein|nr:hypothetical protein [Solirubrobacteraceae bacterium]